MTFGDPFLDSGVASIVNLPHAIDFGAKCGAYLVTAQAGPSSGTTRWTLRGSVPRISEGYVTKFAPHKAPKSIVTGQVTFDERVLLHRVACVGCPCSIKRLALSIHGYLAHKETPPPSRTAVGT